jgi:ribonucleoside-diphosphate reductase alpha chain
MTDFIAKTENEVGFGNARYSAMRERSIGLGWMGFHSFLQDEGIPFESTLAHYENTRIWSWLRQTGEQINVEVADERGANPDCEELGIRRRWSHMFAIAPTASISIIAGTVSACHEPFPANVYTAKTLSGSFEVRNPALERRLNWYADLMFDHMIGYGDMTFAKKRWLANAWKEISDAEGSVQGLNWMLDHDKLVFRTWEEIDQVWVVQHAATRSRDNCGPDQMASNNLFLPADIARSDLHKLHKMAWEKGVPSLYYLRSKSIARVKRGDVAGEMPSPTLEHDIVLKDRGEKIDVFTPAPASQNAEEQSVAAPEVSKYDECLVCQ